MTEAMPFLQKTILLSYDPRPLQAGLLFPAPCRERGVAAFEAAIRFASAPIIRCCAAVGGSAALRMRHTPCG